jgi:pinin
VKRAEQKAQEESERLRQEEREHLAEKRKNDLTLRANLIAQADEKQLELLFLQWTEHHTHLCSFLRTTTKPAIYFMLAKPSEETNKLLQEYQQGLEGWQFQQESTDEQNFSTFPSDFVPLKPVAEGDQPEFSN